ncbi:MAG: hypothetical protein A4S09_10665 [Proteobacteria bacterium SG_bin7]|nr:MAG: hypothetical protein A4S09_10665 [Proteobacteria bacterium SG_bin7]
MALKNAKARFALAKLAYWISLSVPTRRLSMKENHSSYKRRLFELSKGLLIILWLILRIIRELKKF